MVDWLPGLVCHSTLGGKTYHLTREAGLVWPLPADRGSKRWVKGGAPAPLQEPESDQELRS